MESPNSGFIAEIGMHCLGIIIHTVQNKNLFVDNSFDIIKKDK